MNDPNPHSGGINSILLSGIQSTITAASDHLSVATRAELLGPVLASFTTRGTGKTCFTLACFADGLRVVFDAILADGIITEEELDESENFLKEVAASFAKVRPEYARFSNLQRASMLDFINFYKLDTGSFGHKDDATKWSGVTVCENIARQCGSSTALEIFPRSLINAAETLVAADGIAEEEIQFLNELKAELGFQVPSVKENANDSNEAHELSTALHFPEDHWKRCCCFSPTSDLFAIGGEGRITIWDLGTCSPAQIIHGKRDASVESLAFSGDGTRICAYFDADYKVRVFNVLSGARECVLDGDGDDMRIMDVCPGDVILTSTNTHIDSWDLATSEKLSSFKVASGYLAKPKSIALDTNGSVVTVAKEGDEDLRVYKWKESDRIGTCWGGHNEKVELVAAGVKTGSVFSLDERGGLVAWQVPAGEILQQTQLDLWAPLSFLATPCGRKLIVSGWSTVADESGVILFVDTETLEVASKIQTSNRAELTLSPDGKLLGFNSSESGFVVADARSETLSCEAAIKIESPATDDDTAEWDEDLDPIEGEEKIEGIFNQDGWTLPLDGNVEWCDLLQAAGFAREASLLSAEDWRLAQSENRILTIEHSGDGMEYVGRPGLSRGLNLCRVVLGCSLPHEISVVNVDVADIDCNFHGAQEDNDQLSMELIAACEEGEFAKAKILITRGANVSYKDWENDTTPLHTAIRNGHFEIVELLLNSGIEPQHENEGWSIAMLAGQIDVAARLKERGFAAEPLETLVQACHCNVLPAATALIGMVNSIDESANLYNYRDMRATALTSACLAGNLKMAELLLDAGAQISVADARCITPWVAAASGGDTELCRMLESRGAEPDTQHAFIVAADRCHKETLEELVHLVDISEKRTLDDVSVTAIEAALSGRYAGLDSGEDDLNGKDMLIGAVAEYLIAKGASADTLDADGEPLIHKAVNAGYQMVTRVLAEAGANLEAQNQAGETALVIAANNGNADMAGRLLYRRANPDVCDSEGVPASLLMFGEYMQCDAEMAKFFISYGVDLNAKGDSQMNMEQHCERIAESHHEDDDTEPDEYEIEQAREILGILHDNVRLERLHGGLLKSPKTPEQLDTMLQLVMDEYENDASLPVSLICAYIDKNLESSLPKLDALLKHEDWRWRYAAALNLDHEKLSHENVLPLIMARLNDDDDDVRHAVYGTIQGGGEYIISAVIGSLAQCPTESLQQLAHFLISIDSKWLNSVEQTLLALKPTDPESLKGSDRRRAGIVLGILGDFEDQRQNTGNAIELYSRSVQLNPDVQIGFWSELAETKSRNGDESLKNALSMYNETDQTEDREAARTLLEEAAKTAPSFLWALNNLAWALATNPDEDLRDGVKAVELATQVCGQDGWHYPSFLDTLAASHAETGNFDAAVKFSQATINIASPNDVEEFQQNLERYLNGKKWSPPSNDESDLDDLDNSNPERLHDESNEWEQEFAADVSSLGNSVSILAFLNAKCKQGTSPTWLGEPAGTLTNSLGMKFVPIEAGEFHMGDKDCDEGENMGHDVKLTQPFFIGMYPVTQSEYFSVTGENPSHFAGRNRPVEQLTWLDAKRFCELLSDLPEEHAAGRRYRLPTEAEWEYACRAGTTTDFNFGEFANPRHANYSDDGSQERPQPTLPVGSFRPNAWGLYDMHGNVWEWCSDWFDENYYEQSQHTDPQGPNHGEHHTLRGGAASNADYECVSYSRGEASSCDGPKPEVPAYGRFESLGDFGMRVICERVS